MPRCLIEFDSCKTTLITFSALKLPTVLPFASTPAFVFLKHGIFKPQSCVYTSASVNDSRLPNILEVVR